MSLRVARYIGAMVLIGLGGYAAAAPAPKAVVELFTSQGCSSCPPADQLLGELAGRPDVLALSLPVNYWDYLGWKDTLAQPAFTARQKAYAGARGDKQVYTPQIVVNGTWPCVGSDRAKVESLIAKAARHNASPIAIAIAETDSSVKVEIGPSSDAASAEVWLLPIAKAREVQIGRGENKGRTITYVNVVRGMLKLGDWSGAPARFEVPVSRARPHDAEAYVVLLQATAESKPGVILGAAKGPGL